MDPRTSSPVVRTRSGAVRGRVEGGVAVFRGMPFARPPVGALRLAAPVPEQRWDGVREAVAYGPPPPQSRLVGAPAADDAEGDWLTVNVWSPDLGSTRLPVIVWIHGGGYVYGWSGDPSFDGATLARDGSVVVSFNHRVSVEGFGQLRGAPANRGLLDQVAALVWVQDCIAAFGGDPGRVTVMGESAGAGCVAALLTMPRARGLVRRAVAQSVPGMTHTEALATDVTTTIVQRLGVAPVVAEVAAHPPSALSAAADAVASEAAGIPRWGRASFVQSVLAPVVDGEVLPVSPWGRPAAGRADDVDLVVGHTRDEYRLFLTLRGDLGAITDEQAEEALRALAPAAGAYRAAHPGASAEELYERVHSDWMFRMPSARLAGERVGRTHLYELAWTAPGLGGALGACHGLGVPLTFGTLGVGAGAFLVGPEPTQEAYALSSRVRAAWISFAATGDPGWPAYDAGSRLALVVDTVDQVRRYPEEDAVRLWSAESFAPLDLLSPEG